LIASVFSTVIALSVNPWLSYNLSAKPLPNPPLQGEGIASRNKKKKINIRKYYLSLMEKFL